MPLAGNTTIFVVDGCPFEWADVKMAASIWGEWEVVERSVLDGLACLRIQECELGRPNTTVVEAAANEFRYERNLIAAEEMNAWLDQRGIAPLEWMNFIARSTAREAHGSELASIVARPFVPEAELASLAECESLCSGVAGEVARRLAASVVLTHRRAGKLLQERDLRPGKGEVRIRTAEISAFCSAFEELREMVVTPETVTRTIAERNVDWMRLDCRVASYASEDAAREAASLIRHEGTAFDAAALVAGSREQRMRLVLEDLDPNFQTSLLSARVGALLGPLDFCGRAVLIVVMSKLPPTPDDPDLRDRASKVLLGTAIEREAAGARFLVDL